MGATNLVLKDKLLDSLPLEGYTQVVRNNTRHSTNKKSTLLDHIWYNNLPKLVQVRNIETDSDHDLISCITKVNGNVSTPKSTRSRDFKDFNENDFKLELLGQNWLDIYDSVNPTVIAS